VKLAAVLLAVLALAGCARRVRVLGPLPTGTLTRIIIITPEVPCWHGPVLQE
jgi:hypothetical protein